MLFLAYYFFNKLNNGPLLLVVYTILYWVKEHCFGYYID